MPNWKKVIISGSDAIVSSLSTSGTITNASAVGASHITGSFTGSYQGDGSNLTGIEAGGIFAATGSIQATTNTVQVTGSLSVDGTIQEAGFTIPGLIEKMVVDSSSTSILDFTTVTNNDGELLVAN